MNEVLESLIDLFLANPIILSVIGGFSAVAFAGTLVAIPILLVRLPPDYFLREAASPHPLRRVLRNAAGITLLVAGIAMLFLPGQGLLTLFIALTLVDFPNKRKIELSILRKPKVKHAVDSLRRRYGHEAVRLPALGAKEKEEW
ncbi:MAG: PGPGW domain-containing protein [Spirochaetaceae bacterium]